MNQRDFYRQDGFILEHSTLYAEDSAWKFETLRPYLDAVPQGTLKGTILDIGGGAGLILKLITNYVSGNLAVTPDRAISMDLSPKALLRQVESNPQITGGVLGDVQNIPLRPKSIDLTLLIDVIEHVYQLEDALREVRRVSRFVLLKVPLEKNLYVTIVSLLTRGRYRENLRDRVGHIHRFNKRSLEKLLEDHLGTIVRSGFSNVFAYYLHGSSGRYRGWKSQVDKFVNWTATLLFKFSPRLTSRVFYDFALVLVECRD